MKQMRKAGWTKSRDHLGAGGLWFAIAMLVAGCGPQATGEAMAEELDCEATRRLAIGESYQTDDGFRLTVQEVAPNQSAIDALGDEVRGFAARIEVCTLSGAGEEHFEVGFFRACELMPALFGPEPVAANSASDWGTEFRSPALPGRLAPQAGECEQGWLAFPERWVGPEGERATPVGVYYQELNTSGRIFWKLE